MTPVRVRLADLRQKLGRMSQAELARRAGIRRATIVELEQGRATRVSLSVLEKLALALDVEPGELLERDGRSNRKRRNPGTND